MPFRPFAATTYPLHASLSIASSSPLITLSIYRLLLTLFAHLCFIHYVFFFFNLFLYLLYNSISTVLFQFQLHLAAFFFAIVSFYLSLNNFYYYLLVYNLMFYSLLSVFLDFLFQAI